MKPPIDPVRLAARVERLLRNQPFVAVMNIALRHAAQGHVVLAMDVTPALANGHGTGHGGAVFTLADMAFGAAALYAGAVVTVSSDFHFLRVARPATRLLAEAREISRTARTGLYSVSIAEEGGEMVAFGTFRGQWIIQAKSDPYPHEAHPQ